MRLRALCAGLVELYKFNVSEHYYVSLLAQYPLDYHSTYAKGSVMIITHALVRKTRRVHNMHNLPSAPRALSAAYTILSDPTSPAHAYGELVA